MNELTTTEHSRLIELEGIVKQGLETFIDVGYALMEIRDSRLYRQDYETFSDYVQGRWLMSRQHAYRLIDAASVAINLSPIGDKPQNEAQARALTNLEPEEQREVWQTAVATAPNGKVTAAHVEQVKREYLEPLPHIYENTVVGQAMAATVFSHNSLEYYTPAWVIRLAREVMGTIDLDPASCDAAQEIVKAENYYTIGDNGLLLDWFGNVWLNPPYSKTDGRSNQEIWSEKLIENYLQGQVDQGILLVKAAIGYKWFTSIFTNWPCCLLYERLSFVLEDGSDDGQSKQGTALFYLGDNYQLFEAAFSPHGKIIYP